MGYTKRWTVTVLVKGIQQPWQGEQLANFFDEKGWSVYPFVDPDCTHGVYDMAFLNSPCTPQKHLGWLNKQAIVRALLPPKKKRATVPPRAVYSVNFVYAQPEEAWGVWGFDLHTTKRNWLEVSCVNTPPEWDGELHNRHTTWIEPKHWNSLPTPFTADHSLDEEDWPALGSA
eukprot:TRINITY_DN65929_c0_g1_i10.p1 TRINITY_DN65929_c0_g1~~TRINITY_DN65929_c0_g1_i10.p1  ORF type:complete len:173 (+),score=5.64 TRINITY_DN65929_c0_g1_i10:341-859(+)